MELESRLRRALAGTHERPPRRIAERGPVPASPRGGPELNGIERLRPASVLVPIMRRPGAMTVLLTRRSESLRAHRGQVSFPGGGREPADESAAATALREAYEEVGLPPEAVEIFGYLDDYPTITRFLVTPVVGFVEDIAHLRHDPAEVAHVFEVPLGFLVAPGRFVRAWVEHEGQRFPVLEFAYGGERIWGATAAILSELVSRLERSP